MSWQERLASLRDLLLWDHALHLGLHILAVAQPVKAQVSTAIGADIGVDALCSCPSRPCI